MALSQALCGERSGLRGQHNWEQGKGKTGSDKEEREEDQMTHACTAGKGQFNSNAMGRF